MGGDGGVIASNRRYMRGAGTADHTGDGNNNNNGTVDPAVEREELRRTMTTCAVSGEPLLFGSNNGETIVVCPYGRLYYKEAALQALLQRKQGSDGSSSSAGGALGAHVRGLKDLHDVRFHLTTGDDDHKIPTCPIRGTEFNGQIPALVLVPGGTTVNVVSERAMKEMGHDSVVEEYGPVKKTIRVAPTAVQLKEIMQKLEMERSSSQKKKSKGGGDKRKRKQRDESNTAASTNNSSALGDEIRATVAAKVQKSEALSSLFTSSSSSSQKAK